MSGPLKFVQRFVNRNPRNMERMRLQEKPSGWDFEKNRQQRNSIYRVDFTPSKTNTSAYLMHYTDGPIVSASTKEKVVGAQLYSNTDVCAAYNIGRLLAHRAKMAGITHCALGEGGEDVEKNKRTAKFVEALVEHGMCLEEQETIPHNHLNDPNLTWEPFTIKHTREDKLDELDLKLEPGKGVC